MTDPRTLHFTSRRASRAQRVQGLRHAFVGAALVLGGLQALRPGGHGPAWPDAAGIVAGVLLIGAFARELGAARRGAPHAGHGPNLVDVFAAAVTGVEAWHLHHQGKHLLPFAYLFAAALLLAIGLFHGRLARLRRLRLDDDGFDIRLSPWKRTRLDWSQVAQWRRDACGLDLTRRDGTLVRLDLSDAPERETVLDALVRELEARPAPPAEEPAPDEPAGGAPAPPRA
ncbi:MAG: hypothetical protein U0599_31130 [Vicinamibacteria bacterium]